MGPLVLGGPDGPWNPGGVKDEVAVFVCGGVCFPENVELAAPGVFANSILRPLFIMRTKTIAAATKTSVKLMIRNFIGAYINYSVSRWCPREESNLDYKIRNLVSCPLNDEGFWFSGLILI